MTALHTSLLDTLISLETILPTLAQREIMPRFNQIGFSYKQDGSVVTEADTAMQKTVAEVLNKHWPQFLLLGEEMAAERQQQLLQSSSEGLWVLDPLDGTSNFASGIPIFSVSLALIQNGDVQMGLIYDPVRDECFSAIKGQGARLNAKSMVLNESRQHINQCIAQVDLKRLPQAMASRLAVEHPFASQRNFGSGALDWGWLAAGRSQLYVHGGQKLWDYLAGQLILHEAGGYAESFDKTPVFLPVLKPRSVMAAVNRPLYEAWSDWLLSV